MSSTEPQAGATRRRDRGYQDGITTMMGNCTFSGGGVSISISIIAGTSDGTSSFQAAAAAGNSVPSNATWKAATWTTKGDGTKVLTCSTLPAATVGTAYTVGVRYVLNTVQKNLAGTVAGTSVVLNASPAITLS